MKKLGVFLLLLISNNSFATQKISLMLDWFVNPDHAAIIVAQQKGFFKKHDLEVEISEPADPSMPPKLVAAGKVDMAVGYQPQLQMQVDNGLPLVRVATLIATPLNTVIVLKKSGIKSMADLKGKTIGFSVSGFEDSLLSKMLQQSGLSLQDVHLVNVNWSLSPSLLTGKVDAVIGGFRNFELNQLEIEKEPGFALYPEENGVPAYDELVLTINKNQVDKKKFDTFLTALEEATLYTINHPDAAWKVFVSYKPKELDNRLNHMAWKDTLPRLALRPRALDKQRYQRMGEFLFKLGVTEHQHPLSDYAVELPVNQ